MITCDKYNSRHKRRAAIKNIAATLSSIRDAQIIALENTPCNLKLSEAFEDGEVVVDTLDEVIDMLADIY
jgi:hypothetical protein